MMKNEKREKITKQEVKELLEQNNFYSRMAMQKAGHVGLVVMAAYIMLKEQMGGEEEKYSKLLLGLSMGLMTLDDVKILIYEIKERCNYYFIFLGFK